MRSQVPSLRKTPEVAPDGRPGRQIVWQCPKFPSRAVYVENRVQDLSHVCGPRASALFGRGDQGLQDLPLGILKTRLGSLVVA
jgi:hypothetical protein